MGAALLAGGAAPAIGAECGSEAAAQPFIDHINSAHLERSPFQQVQDLLKVDSYVLAHTVLAESILAPLLPAGDGAVDPFVAHVNAAHLERSPFQQVQDLLKVDDYVLAHTVLVESMLAPTVSGCGDGGDSPPTTPAHGTPAPPPPAAPAAAPAAPAATAVEIRNYAFAPKEITVPAGTAVTWTNGDDDGHTVTGSGLNSRTFGKGGTYSFTFASPGTFAYACSLHPQMKGTVKVQ